MDKFSLLPCWRRRAEKLHKQRLSNPTFEAVLREPHQCLMDLRVQDRFLPLD